MWTAALEVRTGREPAVVALTAQVNAAIAGLEPIPVGKVCWSKDAGRGWSDDADS